MPRPLQGRRVPAVWQFQMHPEQANEFRRCLTAFFTGDGPELIEWCVGLAAVRSSFEREWVEQDALWLMESFERLQTSSFEKGPISIL